MKAETTDFFLSAFLIHQGFTLIEMRSNGDRKIFVFEDSPQYQGAKNQYYLNDALVDPRMFKQSIRKLKGEIMR